MTEIGTKITQVAHEQGLSIEKLAKKVNLTTAALYRLLKRNDMKISRLQQFSGILKHDFFQYLHSMQAKQLPEYLALKEENKQLKQQIKSLQRENNLLNDFVQVLKSHTPKD